MNYMSTVEKVVEGGLQTKNCGIEGNANEQMEIKLQNLHAKKKIYVGLFIMLMKRKMLKGEIFKS